MKRELIKPPGRRKREYRTRVWKRIVSGVACAALAGTACVTSSLALPGVSVQENSELICGYEEHVHTADCYEQIDSGAVLSCTAESLGIHQHTADCYNEQKELICGYADFVVHTHDELCYDEAGNLVCQLPEIREHIHTEECYGPEQTVVVDAGHTHTADCYEFVQEDQEVTAEAGADEEPDGISEGIPEDSDSEDEADIILDMEDDSAAADARLICGQEERPRVESVERELLCGKEEIEVHEHTKDCYRVETEADGTEHKVLICEKPVVLSHQHTEACFQSAGPQSVLTCNMEAHQHSDACFKQPEESDTEEQSAEPEEADTEEQSAEPEETDTEAQTGQLEMLNTGEYSEQTEVPDTGEQPELSAEAESDSGQAGQPEMESDTEEADTEAESETESETGEASGDLQILTYKGTDYTVTVRFGADAALPEDVTLEAPEIEQDTDEYKSYYEQAFAALSTQGTELPEELPFARFFDVKFLFNGEVVEPEAPVTVEITYDSVPDVAEGAKGQAIHFAEQGTELLEVTAETQADGSTSFVHTQDSFSVVGSLLSVPYSARNSTEIGPKLLPVDYYVNIDNEWVCVGSTKTGWYGDYTTGDWSNTNRDYITEAQAASVLGTYGFTTGGENAMQQLAYQRKEVSADAALHSDTNSYSAAGIEGKVLPLARNADPASGYNLYYLPGNTATSWSSSLDALNTDGSRFYTVSVYDPGHVAYGEDARVPDTQIVRQGNVASVTVAPLSSEAKAAGVVWKCLDGDWKAVADGTVTTTSNNDGTITFNLTNITGPRCITPVIESLGTEFDDTVHYMVYLDDQWIEAGATSTIYKREDFFKRYFITAAQAESVLAPYGFRAAAYNFETGKGNCLTHQLGEPNVNGYFYSNNDATQLSDGSWVIGLSYSESEYSMYYFPANSQSFTEKTPAAFAESDYMQGNRFYTVRVADHTNSIYTDGELSAMTQITREGGTVTVSVKNAEGMLWSCVGKHGAPVQVEESQSGGITTFTLTDITQPIEVTATKVNPSFTVQYYAEIPRYATAGDNALTVIDTSGRKLPTNGGTMATKPLYLEPTGKYTNQNNGQQTELYKVKTTNELTKVYADSQYEYVKAPGITYFDKLSENTNYKLEKIGVLKEGKDPSSTNSDDWEWYSYSYKGEGPYFTNLAGEAEDTTILLEDETVIRLYFKANEAEYTNNTTLYDYDISSGQNSDGRWRTGITGINSEENYGTSLNGQRNWSSYADVLAFGNANCGTGMSGYLFDGGTLNKYNTNNKNYGGCTFGLVNSLNTDGTIRYNDWLVAPKLFNDGSATGKRTYNNGSLKFEQTGDTYTLTSAFHSSTGSANDLQYFFNPSPTSGTIWPIFTNNFWPMDSVSDQTDPLMGKYLSTGSFQGFSGRTNESWSNQASNFPPSDDGNAHNWFFGMNFTVDFTLTEDYVGPLEYYFFGDDDMWVFLDNQLVCDIGGVHSSVGEYVNLRDYLPEGSSGKHTLSFFYTERGASGSTCWMSFTLPSVSNATTVQTTGGLKISKEVEGAGDNSDEEFEFAVELGSGGTYSYTRKRSDDSVTYGTVKSGGTLKLKSGEYAIIDKIPAGTSYKVTEVRRDGYTTTANGEAGYIVEGIVDTGNTAKAAFVNTLSPVKLPETGGPGTIWYTLGGIALLLGGALLYEINRRRKEARQA